jgi:hypothetical protein
MSPPHLRRAYHPPSPRSIVASGALRWILTEGAIVEPSSGD